MFPSSPPLSPCSSFQLRTSLCSVCVLLRSSAFSAPFSSGPINSLTLHLILNLECQLQPTHHIRKSRNRLNHLMTISLDPSRRGGYLFSSKLSNARLLLLPSWLYLLAGAAQTRWSFSALQNQVEEDLLIVLLVWYKFSPLVVPFFVLFRIASFLPSQPLPSLYLLTVHP